MKFSKIRPKVSAKANLLPVRDKSLCEKDSFLARYICRRSNRRRHALSPYYTLFSQRISSGFSAAAAFALVASRGKSFFSRPSLRSPHTRTRRRGNYELFTPAAKRTSSVSRGGKTRVRAPMPLKAASPLFLFLLLLSLLHSE